MMKLAEKNRHLYAILSTAVLVGIAILLAVVFGYWLSHLGP